MPPWYTSSRPVNSICLLTLKIPRSRIGKNTNRDVARDQRIITIAPTKHPTKISDLPYARPSGLKSPDANTPHNPQAPWIENASSGSSTWSLFRVVLEP